MPARHAIAVGLTADMEQLCAEGLVDTALNERGVGYGCLYGMCGDGVVIVAYLLVYILRSGMEDIAECAVVYLVDIIVVGLTQMCHMLIVVEHLAPEVCPERCRRYHSVAEHVCQLLHDKVVLYDRVGGGQCRRLACCERETADRTVALDHNLEHEARHLTCIHPFGR